MAKLSTTKDWVGTDSATIKYKLENNYTGGSVSYSWDFGSTEASGQKTFYNLKIDNDQKYITITAKCTITIQSDESTTTYTEQGNIKIFLHPGSFSMGAEQYNPDENQIGDKTIISNILTKEKIDKWAERYNKVYRWWNQNENDYDNLNLLKVNKGEPVTAEWYNNCIAALNEVREKQYYLPTVNKDDLITAEIINRLSFKGPGQ